MAQDFFNIDKGISLSPRAAAPGTPEDGDVYYDSTLATFQFRENGVWVPLGSGGGTGGINYLQRAGYAWDFEFNNVTGWNKYANTVTGAVPEVSPGGTPSVNVTLASTAVNPLRQTYSALLTKDASNRQGNGVRTSAFTIDKQDVGKTIFISFDYNMSVNYAPGDISVYISDGTNIITPSTVALPSSSGTFRASFAATSSTSYRLYFHIASTNALAYTMTFDTVVVGPQSQLVASSIGDWQSYTAPITSTGTSPTKGTIVVDTAYWRRVGDSMELAYNFKQSSAGTAGTGQYLFGLPSGYAIDSTKVLVNTDRTLAGIVGHAYGFIGTETHGSVFASTTTGLGVAYHSSLTNPQNIASIQNGNFDLSNSAVTYTFFAKVPIAGWSSNIQFATSFTEYAFNTGSVTSASGSDSTSFGNGPAGTTINAFNSTTTNANTTLRVQFQNPIQPTDIIQVETQRPNSTIWTPVEAEGWQSTYMNNAFYGIGWVFVTGQPNQIDVRFYNAGATPDNCTTYGSTGGDAWSLHTANKWRVRKSSGIGMGEVLPAGYSEGTFTANFNLNAGAGGSATSFTVSFVKLGNQVTLQFPPMDVMTAGATNVNFSTASGTLLAGLIPTSSNRFPCRMVRNGVASATAGFIELDTNGTIKQVCSLDGLTTFTSGWTNTGADTIAISYTIL